MEPDWHELEGRLRALTMAKLRQLGRRWFAVMLGGASTKREVAQTMVSQARHWWHSCGPEGRERVVRALQTLGELEAAS